MRNVFYTLTIVLISLLTGLSDIQAQQVTKENAIVVAGNYSRIRKLNLDITRAEPLIYGTDSIAWLMFCQPKGFIIIAASQFLPPVIAWSDAGDFDEGGVWDNFLPILQFDLKTRNEFVKPGSAYARNNMHKWETWLNPGAENRLFEQWPAEGWSSTGGWLFTNWTQTSPYNALCPVDGQTHIRSIAGCPSTAMAQIVNFHHNLNQTRFSDADDYYHNYGTGNMYWIDNDWESYDFPSWDQLNVYLDTLESHYNTGVPLKNTDMAALTYACGVAAKQVYTSSASGTFSISQAFDAFIRFGYSDAQLVYPSDPHLNTHLAQNIQMALPAHLGIVNEAWTVGHNVVVDGYNTDELYHFNFGWGGSANGWYTMPPEDIPYDLTVIEGIVMDINLSNPPVGIDNPAKNDALPGIYYNSQNEMLVVNFSGKTENAKVEIFDMSGRLVKSVNLSCSASGVVTEIDLSTLPDGLFIARNVVAEGKIVSCKFVR